MDNLDMENCDKGAVITLKLETPDIWIVKVRRIGSDAAMEISTELANWGEITGLAAKGILEDIMKLS